MRMEDFPYGTINRKVYKIFYTVALSYATFNIYKYSENKNSLNSVLNQNAYVNKASHK